MGFLDKERNRSTEAREELQLELLIERCQKCRIKLLLNIIAKEDAHPIHCAYEEVIKQTEGVIHTRSQSRNEPRSISTTGNSFSNSFVPRTIRDLKK